MSDSKSLNEISWSPNRSNVLASISRDEKVVKVWEFQDKVSQTEGDSKELELWNSTQSKN